MDLPKELLEDWEKVKPAERTLSWLENLFEDKELNALRKACEKQFFVSGWLNAHNRGIEREIAIIQKHTKWLEEHLN